MSSSPGAERPYQTRYKTPRCAKSLSCLTGDRMGERRGDLWEVFGSVTAVATGESRFTYSPLQIDPSRCKKPSSTP
jgi:NADH:ubiquinone oxidoreductase subunit D